MRHTNNNERELQSRTLWSALMVGEDADAEFSESVISFMSCENSEFVGCYTKLLENKGQNHY